jgi:hypothetical protein
MRSPWDRYMEGYLRDRGVVLAAVICPTTVDGAGLVHLHDAAYADLTVQLLTEHPDVREAAPAEAAATLVYFRVREDIGT